MADLIRASQGAIAAAVGRFDGHVAKWMGDGAIVYFGYPRAHEDDAERAVRAGLALIEAVAALRRERAAPSSQVRIGIATGLVVVGELIGEGEARQRGRRRRYAQSRGTAAVAAPSPTPSWCRRRRGACSARPFELKPLGPQTLKGFEAPVPAWRVQASGKSSAVSRPRDRRR